MHICVNLMTEWRSATLLLGQD